MNAKLREKAKAPIFEAEVIKHLGKKLEIHTAEEAAIVEKALAKAAYIIEEATKKSVNVIRCLRLLPAACSRRLLNV